jgi:hypothetical protein
MASNPTICAQDTRVERRGGAVLAAMMPRLLAVAADGVLAARCRRSSLPWGVTFGRSSSRRVRGACRSPLGGVLDGLDRSTSTRDCLVGEEVLDDGREVLLPVLEAAGVRARVQLVELLGEDGEALAILMLHHVKEGLVDHVVDVVASLDDFPDVVQDSELPLRGVSLVLLLPEALHSIDLPTSDVLLVGIPEVDHRACVSGEVRRKIESSSTTALVDGLEGHVEELVKLLNWRGEVECTRVDLVERVHVDVVMVTRGDVVADMNFSVAIWIEVVGVGRCRGAERDRRATWRD